MLSMSEDAISSFERRGLPFRDVFDSAFDEVVRVPYLECAESVSLSGRRLSDLPLQFGALAYCQSAGLPRDLLRATGRILSLSRVDQSPPSPATVAWQVVHRDLRGKAEAVTAAIKSSAAGGLRDGRDSGGDCLGRTGSRAVSRRPSRGVRRSGALRVRLR
nr:hypothetical protein [uncultured Actinoplanes sp.]